MTAHENNGIDLLLIDDDARFRSGIRRVLRGMSRLKVNRVCEAGDGSSGLAMLQKVPGQIDCVCIDYQMPGGSGIEWMERMLAVQPDLAVVMITGQGDEEIAVRALHAGAMDYLVKGVITPENLERALANVIEKRQLKQTLEKQREDLFEAERQRVMLESLGAACHHLGQPATAILAYLEMLQIEETDPEKVEIMGDCIRLARKIADILHKLQRSGTYRTVPYISMGGDTVRILDIEENSEPIKPGEKSV